MKTETSTLFKKLKEYSALAAPLLATASFANAQIVYKNIEPDKVLDAPTQNGVKYKLDLNNDGVFDLYFAHRFVNSELRLNEVVPSSNVAQSNVGFIGAYLFTTSFASQIVNIGSPYVFSTGVMINSNTPWMDFEDINFSYNSGSAWFPMLMGGYDYGAGSYFGYWAGVVDQFLPLRVDNGPDTFYGWARCDVALDGTSLTIKDCAFQSTPGVGIEAGDMGNVGINTPGNPNDVLIFSSSRVLNVNFNTKYSFSASIQLFTVMGQKVLSQKVTAAENQINLSQLAAGNYLVHVIYDNKVITKQVTVH